MIIDSGVLFGPPGIPLKGMYLLVCMNSILYYLLTSYTLIMF